MSKRYRFIILLIVLVVCFLFLWPTIRWYFFTPLDKQELAQIPREKIREDSYQAAMADWQRLIESARVNGPLPENLEFLIPIARNLHKDYKAPVPESWTALSILETFQAYSTRRAAQEAIEQRYADEIFALKELQNNAVKLGLDLSGGLSIILQVGRTLSNDDPVDAMNRALEVLNSRIDRFGLTEPVIRGMQSTNQIYIEIPGTADPERINDIIMGKGSLTFQLQDDEATTAFYEYYSRNRGITIDNSGSIYNEYGQTVSYESIPGLSSSVVILGVYTKDRYGLDEHVRNIDGTYSYIAVNREIGLDGNYIEDAIVERNNISGRPEVAFRLSEEGGEIFYRLTSANINKNLAIVMDGKVRSAPNISTGIRERGTITGFDQESSENLALVLRTAALPVELEVASQQSIGASLGEDTIRQGLFALLGGIAAVLIFMLVFYKAAGINAVVAQLLNFYIMFSVLSALNFTLTLPAIAGFILTIGMATDANVIIFERMKEEMRLGKSRKAVVEAGFGKAFWAIMDSNITTFIAALFLSQLGSGPIRGFAVSLSIGVFSSVFTALFVSRLIFDFGTDVMKSKDLSVSWTAHIQEGASGSEASRTRAVSL
ncbi:MAG: protein translocase subunit SecD [Treponema sp.]|nr:protein translocase subunit SecD [Treponema sp.]